MTGFKSFAEPEHISIDDGMTGIVGPNGCGKSNIVESLRWLMGESSAKSMRGGELEDIIFAGSASRPSRNFAEVTLTLDNSARTAPSALNDGDDIEITRRIERGKGSSFKINGKASRARDVQLLFADMATGSRSSGIVSQGKVGAIINAKPVERRNLLEEAANIRGLHQRRHEAELRLNTAETNLERLEDILIQLDEQKASLTKQARQAARYRSIADRIRKADAHLMLARFTLTVGRLEDAQAQLRDAERLTAAATEEASSKSRHRNTVAETLPPLRQDEAVRAAEFQRLSLERDALDQEEERVKKAVQDVAARRQQITTDFAREKQLLTDADRAIEALTEEQAAITAANNDDEPKRAAAAEELEQARAAATDAEQALADAAAKSRAAERETEALTRRIGEHEQRLAQANTALDQLNLDQLKATAERHAAERLKAEEHAAAIKTKRAASDGQLTTAQDAARTANAKVSEAREEFARIRAESDALSALLTPQDTNSGTPVSSAIKVSGGLEVALAAVLGDSLSAPVGRHDNAYWLDSTGPALTPPQGMTPLADHLDLPGALTAAISGIGVADSADAAASAQSRLEPGQAITTADGGLWRWDGFVQPVGAETSAAQRLKQEARLRELTAERDGKQTTLAEAEEKAAATAKTLAELEAESRTLGDDERAADQQLNAATRADETAKAAHQSAQRRHDELTETRAELTAALAEAKAEADSLSNPEALTLDVDTLTAKAEECRQRLAEAMGSERVIRSAREGREKRMRDIEREMSIWTDRQKGAHARLDELTARQSQAEQDARQLASQPDDITARRHKLGDAIDTAEANRQQAADRLAEAETTLALAENAQRDADQALAQQRETYIRAESQRDLAMQDRDSIVNRIRERLNVIPDGLRALAELNPEDTIDTDEATITALESRHERLLRERENIGPVNLRAEAEMEEVDSRIASIHTERDDLNGAIAKLRSAINQLNREGRERLLKSFADVNRYFETLFKTLFNGGSAELTLTEADDPLEAGLEILASPPGKKLQSLSLLSGGEQALTALALIFAVFLTNPSPICILDDVDAPLDDTNVARFCDMLGQIADETGTRFIVVTHHRLTMAKMDRLYGVTMEQKGVSRIVSVDLQTAEKYRETA
ncbi:MAG: AAA family ATPase [Alphaproteobacteria bacterium]|nr:AAA family ATPase [Alphaproteobacteria bacterium]